MDELAYSRHSVKGQNGLSVFAEESDYLHPLTRGSARASKYDAKPLPGRESVTFPVDTDKGVLYNIRFLFGD